MVVAHNAWTQTVRKIVAQSHLKNSPAGYYVTHTFGVHVYALAHIRSQLPLSILDMSTQPQA